MLEENLVNAEKVVIRVATVGDAERLLQIYAPYVVNTAITFEYEVPTVQEFRKRIYHVLERYPYLVAEKNEELLGFAYASAFHERAAYDWAVETSIYICMDKRKVGIGRKLHDCLEKILKEQGVLNLNACIAYPRNEDEYLTKNSVEFHSHLGYRLVGEFYQCGYKFNRWYNMVWMEKQIGEHISNQPAVKNFNFIRKKVETEKSL
ncbi:Phosphinothricin N-acetyltransferase [Clostridiales bacterium CHKCI001]|nr:Phosphinothricin N-acetyltransferase [Clostridiales bacterium CHKCI001]